MNYLAHLYLSPSGDECRLGNLLGDFVKHKGEFIAYDKIYQGICFHQKIDQFMDSHPIILKSRQRISKKNRRYAGIIIDVFYDHFLAKNWGSYSHISLENFVENIYIILEKYSLILPKRLLDIKSSMIRENWLLSYREQTGIANTLKRIANRLRVFYAIDEAMAELKTNYQELEMDFNLFFNDAIEYAKSIAIQDRCGIINDE
jgi:acyl carrier protein phosphodiesterase